MCHQAACEPLFHACAQEAGLLARLGAAAQDAAGKESAARREDALCAYGALAESGCPAAVPALLPALPVMLDRLSDKARTHACMRPRCVSLRCLLL
jgi:hypothetical protein